MSPHPYDAVVVSPRALVGALLAALLRARGIERVVVCGSTLESLSLAKSAPTLLCDAGHLSAADFASFQARVQQLHPKLRVIRVDDASDAAVLDAAVAATLAAARTGSRPHDSLTPLEAEVMLAVAAGLRNADIARRMRRSAKTIEKHRANALRKLGIRSVAQLTAYALRHRLLDGDAILGPRTG